MTVKITYRMFIRHASNYNSWSDWARANDTRVGRDSLKIDTARVKAAKEIDKHTMPWPDIRVYKWYSDREGVITSKVMGEVSKGTRHYYWHTPDGHTYYMNPATGRLGTKLR